MAGSRYLMIEPSVIVNIILPLHLGQCLASGGLLNFSLQFTHLNCCIENFLKFPLISLMKCFSMTNLATFGASTALIMSASSIWPFSFSSIEGSILYAEHLTPELRFSTECVKPKPSYCLSVSRWFPSWSILTSHGILYCMQAS